MHGVNLLFTRFLSLSFSLFAVMSIHVNLLARFCAILLIQVALVALATNPSFHKELLSTVKSWPSAIYSALPVISAIEPQLDTSSMTDALKEVNCFVLC